MFFNCIAVFNTNSNTLQHNDSKHKEVSIVYAILCPNMFALMSVRTNTTMIVNYKLACKYGVTNCHIYV